MDNSGSISKHELLQMLNDTFTEVTQDLSATMKQIIQTHLDEVASKIIKVLDKDGSEVLEWPEFKQYMHTFTKEQQTIMNIIRKARESGNY